MLSPLPTLFWRLTLASETTYFLYRLEDRDYPPHRRGPPPPHHRSGGDRFDGPPPSPWGEGGGDEWHPSPGGPRPGFPPRRPPPPWARGGPPGGPPPPRMMGPRPDFDESALIPKVPYYELPAGLMAPLVKVRIYISQLVIPSINHTSE